MRGRIAAPLSRAHAGRRKPGRADLPAPAAPSSAGAGAPSHARGILRRYGPRPSRKGIGAKVPNISPPTCRRFHPLPAPRSCRICVGISDARMSIRMRGCKTRTIRRCAPMWRRRTPTPGRSSPRWSRSWIAWRRRCAATWWRRRPAPRAAGETICITRAMSAAGSSVCSAVGQPMATARRKSCWTRMHWRKAMPIASSACSCPAPITTCWPTRSIGPGRGSSRSSSGTCAPVKCWWRASPAWPARLPGRATAAFCFTRPSTRPAGRSSCSAAAWIRAPGKPARV